jgi:hypothetical protein
LVRKADTVTPAPPKADIRIKPMEEQLAQVLESTLRVEPENRDDKLTFSFFECLSTYTFMLTTKPMRIDVIFERTKPATASPGK